MKKEETASSASRRTWREQRQPPEVRLVAYCEADLNTGCWLWSGPAGSNGYGRMYIDGVNTPVHRYSWERHNGRALPPDRVICHKCDTPLCFNPDHLWAGTPGENTRDRDAKQRQARGERINLAKLTEAQVVTARELHASGQTMTSIADLMSVTKGTIRLIVRRKTWKHVGARDAQKAA